MGRLGDGLMGCATPCTEELNGVMVGEGLWGVRRTRQRESMRSTRNASVTDAGQHSSESAKHQTRDRVLINTAPQRTTRPTRHQQANRRSRCLGTRPCSQPLESLNYNRPSH